MSKADERNDISVQQYIDSLADEALKSDASAIMQMMHDISGENPVLYGIGTIGYGVYKYHYTSGRKGDAHTLAFYPRKGKITVYLMDGTAHYSALLAKLGKHSTTGYCIYIKELSDIDVSALQQILEQSFQNITTLSKAGPIDHMLWQDKK
jgi:hypothetical protein